MERLLLYRTGASGHGAYERHREMVLSSLRDAFEVEEYLAPSIEEGKQKIIEASKSVSAILVVGGDGTFLRVVEALLPLEKKPVLGYLNDGTLGDVGRSFGIPSSISKGLRIFLERNEREIDVGLLGDKPFVYMAAVGAYADISYGTKRSSKKAFRRLAYYFRSLKEAFHKREISYRILVDDKEIKGTSPFLLVLNGSHVGGFRINKNGKNDDGKLELFLTKKGPFNGLLPYFFAPKKVPCLTLESARIEIEGDETWTLDGEKGEKGSLSLTLLHKAIRVYGKKEKRR